MRRIRPLVPCCANFATIAFLAFKVRWTGNAQWKKPRKRELAAAVPSDVDAVDLLEVADKETRPLVALARAFRRKSPPFLTADSKPMTSTFARELLRSFEKISTQSKFDINRDADDTEDLVTVLYAAAYYRIWPIEYRWLPVALSRNILYFTADHVTRAAFALSSLMMTKELSMLESPIHRQSERITQEQAAIILLAFAKSGKLEEHKGVLIRLGVLARFSTHGDASKFFSCIRARRGLYAYLLPMFPINESDEPIASTLPLNTYLLAAHAFTCLDLEAESDSRKEEWFTCLVTRLTTLVASSGTRLSDADLLEAVVIFSTTVSTRRGTQALKALMRAALMRNLFAQAESTRLMLIIKSLAARSMFESAFLVFTGMKTNTVVSLDALFMAFLSSIPPKTTDTNLCRICVDIFFSAGGAATLPLSMGAILALLLRSGADTHEANALRILSQLEDDTLARHPSLTPGAIALMCSNIDSEMNSLAVPPTLRTAFVRLQQQAIAKVNLAREAGPIFLEMFQRKLIDEEATAEALRSQADSALSELFLSSLQRGNYLQRTLSKDRLSQSLITALYQTVSIDRLISDAQPENALTLPTIMKILREKCQMGPQSPIKPHQALRLILDRTTHRCPDLSTFEALRDVLVRSDQWNVVNFMEVLLGYGRRGKFNNTWLESHIPLFAKFDEIPEAQIVDAVYCLYYVCSLSVKDHIHKLAQTVLAHSKPALLMWHREKKVIREHVTLLVRAILLSGYIDSEILNTIRENYFADINSVILKSNHPKDRERYEAAYCQLVVTARNDAMYDQLIHEMLPKLCDASVVAILQAMSKSRGERVDRLCEAALERGLKINNFRGFNAHFVAQAVVALEYDNPALFSNFIAHCLRCDNAEEPWSTTDFISTIQVALKTNIQLDVVRDAALARFRLMTLTAEEVPNVIYILARCEVDLLRHIRKIGAVIASSVSKLSGSQLGVTLTAFARSCDRVPPTITDLLLPRIREIIPKLNATEFVNFAYPLMRCDALPQEIGVLLAQGVREKLQSFSPQQASRMCLVLSRSYCEREGLTVLLVQGILKKVSLLPFQEVVTLLATSLLGGEHELQSALLDRFRNVLHFGSAGSGALDANWAITTLARGGRKNDAPIQLCCERIKILAAALNNFETSTLLVTAVGAGLPADVCDRLLQRASELADKYELKPQHITSLISQLLKGDDTCEDVLGALVNLVLTDREKQPVTLAILKQVLDGYGKNKDRYAPSVNARILEKAQQMADSCTDAPYAVEIIVMCLQIDPSLDVERHFARVKIEEVGALLFKFPAMSARLVGQIDRWVTDMATPALATVIKALHSVQQHVPFKERMLSRIDTSIISPMHAVMTLCVLSASTDFEVALLLRLTERLTTVSGAFKTVPPHVCLEALHAIAATHPPTVLRVLHQQKLILSLASRTAESREWNLVTLSRILSTLCRLDLDDDNTIAMLVQRISDQKDSLIMEKAETVTDILRSLDYFGHNLGPKGTYNTLLRFVEVVKVF